MKSVVLFIVILVSTLYRARAADSSDPFTDHSDTGATIRVLPTPAAVHNAHDTQPTFATANSSVNNKASVFPASFGSGNLIYHGGFELSGPGVYGIFWNSSVALSTATSFGWQYIAYQVALFLLSFPDGAAYSNSSPAADYDIIQQYSTGSTPITPALTVRGLGIDSQPTLASISDSGIQNYLTGLFNRGVPVDASGIYAIFFPSGMKVTLTGGASCTTFCGYHSHFSYNGTQIKYAVFPFPDCGGCSVAGLSPGDILTVVMSHEIRETVTDPGDNNVNAWFDSAGFEADDKCAWHNLYQLNRSISSIKFWVQPEYSNGTTNGLYPGPGCVVP